MLFAPLHDKWQLHLALAISAAGPPGPLQRRRFRSRGKAALRPSRLSAQSACELEFTNTHTFTHAHIQAKLPTLSPAHSRFPSYSSTAPHARRSTRQCVHPPTPCMRRAFHQRALSRFHILSRTHTLIHVRTLTLSLTRCHICAPTFPLSDLHHHFSSFNLAFFRTSSLSFGLSCPLPCFISLYETHIHSALLLRYNSFPPTRVHICLHSPWRTPVLSFRHAQRHSY